MYFFLLIFINLNVTQNDFASHYNNNKVNLFNAYCKCKLLIYTVIYLFIYLDIKPYLETKIS